ncbi:hypothetical protein J1N35_015750 [Gossypium stocksii]|uniref:DUF7745 domain-containing protein n=1 Tax=Gossypium stocksii TaxID=47602 RepID=A0A9D3VZ11_9ROSI|nr:hypothetical protein J1N35_015750 [Gossypium stocksii]
MVPTVEEYSALLRCPRIQVDKVYSRANCIPTFVRKLMNIRGISKQWVTAKIKQKGECKCIPWKALKDLILTHLDKKKKVDVFALSIYGLMIFPRESWRGQIHRMCTVAIGLVPQSFPEAPWRDDISEENWIVLLRNLQEDDVEWRAPWQYRSRQFVPTTHGLAQLPSLEGARPIEEYLRVVPSELEIMKQDSEKKSSEFRKQIQRCLAKSQKEKSGLKARVAKLGRSLHQHRSRHSAIELKASLNQIEEMKDKIGRLESVLQNCELCIEQLEARDGHWKEELHHFQEQVRNRDYLMGEATAPIREMADHLQTLAV